MANVIDVTFSQTSTSAWIANYEGKRLYVFADLKNYDNRSDYIRSETKVKIYEELKNQLPKVFEEWAQRKESRSKYPELFVGESSPETSKPAFTTPFTVPTSTPASTNSNATNSGVSNQVIEELRDAIRNMSKPQPTVTPAIVEELRDAIKTLHKPSMLEEEMIKAVISKGAELSVKEIEDGLKKRMDDFIRETYGALPTIMSIKVAENPANTSVGLFHEKFQDILTMVSNNIPVMVTGQAGTGKNFTMEQVAEALGIEFYYTGAVTQEYKISGFIDANGNYHETEFYKAFKNGGLFMLDEVDASAPEVLVVMNAAIANRYFDFPNGRIKAHEDFRVVCAGNTYGTGADMVYVGRNVLDGATLDRFVVIKMDYDSKVEKMLCPDTSYYNFVLDVRKALNKNKIRHIVGMRASINGFKALQAGMSKAFIIESIIAKGLNRDDVNMIIKSGLSTSLWTEELKNYYSRTEG